MARPSAEEGTNDRLWRRRGAGSPVGRRAGELFTGADKPPLVGPAAEPPASADYVRRRAACRRVRVKSGKRRAALPLPSEGGLRLSERPLGGRNVIRQVSACNFRRQLLVSSSSLDLRGRPVLLAGQNLNAFRVFGPRMAKLRESRLKRGV